MSGYNIGITGVGGGVGQSIIKSLASSEYNLIGMDGEPLAAGLYAVPKAYIIPYSNDKKYIESLLAICKSEEIDLLFPGLDAELKLLSLNSQKFKEIGTQVVVSSLDVIDLSDNKLVTYGKLTEIGMNVPKTIDLVNFIKKTDELIFPIIVKQKIGGARSKNVYKVKDKTSFEYLLNNELSNVNDFIAQEYIEGDEYTCGTINFSGQCQGIIIMRRILRDGDTYKCFVERDPKIEEDIINLMNTIKPFGACNIQFRKKNGVPYIFEINARCSGTTAARTICGFNEPKMISDFLLKGVKPYYKIEQKTILRYWKEIDVKENDIDEIGKVGNLNNLSHTFL